MTYSYDQIFSKNDALINRLIAIYIMGELEPIMEGKPQSFSEGGWWMCVQKANESGCEWSPVNFTGSMRWCWKIIKQMKEEPPQVRDNFRYFIDQLKPLEANTEAEACREICRSALLAKLSKIPRPI